MKKTKRNKKSDTLKLKVRRDVLRELNSDELGEVAGGRLPPTCTVKTNTICGTYSH